VIAGFEGTAIWGTYSDFQIFNNVLSGNTQDAIFLHDSSAAVIKNNIIVNNAGYGIIGLETSSAIIDYNDVWGNSGNNYGFVSAGANDISTDPKFVNADAGNYYLQSGSPCIDAGDPNPIFNDQDGSRNDMGAFGGPLSSYLITGIEKLPFCCPEDVLLYQNIPNPFGEETQIHFELPRDGWVNLAVYNMVGQKVRVLVDEIRLSGFHSVKWDAKDENGKQVEDGLYFYQISTDQTRHTRKAVLSKN
jgi:parallel beta-helix repeat protein